MKFLVSTFLFLLASAATATEEATPGIRGLKNTKPVNVPNGKAIGWWCCKPLKADQCAEWETLKTTECESRIAGSDFQGCAVVNNKCEEVKP